MSALRSSYRLLFSHARRYGRRFSNDVRDREILANSMKSLGGNPFIAGASKASQVDESDLLRLVKLPTADLVASEAPHVLRELGNALHKGFVVPADASRAAEMWKHAESKGDLDAGHNLALDEYRVDPEVGVAHLEELAATGHAFSQYSLAQALLNAARQDAAAAASAQNALDATLDGSSSSLEASSSEKRDSLGLVDDRAKRALELFQKATKGGVLPAIHNVANMLANGDGREGGVKDEVKARKWYEAAAELGDPLAMFTLSTWWASGRGGPEDEATALKWCQDAARAGLPRAQFNLGGAYLAGKGTPDGEPNYASAREWFQLAAEQGMPEACINLGEMYRMGLGTPQGGKPDYASARRWHERAKALGNDFAAEILEDDRNFMDDTAAMK